MIWLMLIFIGFLTVTGNDSPVSQRKKQYVSYESPDEETEMDGTATGTARGLDGFPGLGDDHEDSLAQMHITENSYGGLAVADGDLAPLFVGNTATPGSLGGLNGLSAIANSFSQQQLPTTTDDQLDDQTDLSNSNAQDLGLQNLGGYGDKISLFANDNHHSNVGSINSDSRDLDNGQSIDSENASDLEDENTDPNIDSSVNLGETVNDNFGGVQGGLSSLLGTADSAPPPNPPASAGSSSDDKPKLRLGNKQAMADALAKLLASVSSQTGEDRQGVGINDVTDFLGQELNQLDVSDAKLQKMLEQGMDDDTAGPLTAAGTAGGSSPMQSSDAQPSDAPDEMPGISELQGSDSSDNQFGSFGNLMQLPALHFQPGQTVHAHASDKPNSLEDVKLTPGDAAETAQQVQANAQKEHREKLNRLKNRLKLLRQKLQELEEEQAKKSHSSTSTAAKRTDAIKKLLIKNLKLAALIASKEIELEEAKGGATSTKKETDDDEPPHETSSTPKDVGNKAKPLTDLSKKAEEEVNALIKDNKNKNKSVNFNFSNSTTKAKSEILTRPSNASLIKEINETLHQLNTISSVPVSSLKSYSKLLKRIQQMSNAVKKEKTVGKQNSSAVGSLASLYSALKNKSGLDVTRRAPSYKSLGCWKDSGGNLISSMEPLLRQRGLKNYKLRKEPIMVCANLAKTRGYPGFAIEDSGECFAGPSIIKLYRKYGLSVECNKKGTGGPLSLSVYKFIEA